MMYFHGGGLRSERECAESYLETLKQKPVTMVTLFGRQVFPMQSERSQFVDERPRRIQRRDIDLRLPADQCFYNLHRSVVHDKFGSFDCHRDAAEAVKLNSMSKVASTTNWLSERNPVTVIDLEEPPSSLTVTEPSASGSCVASVSLMGINLESNPPVQSISRVQSLVDDDRCFGKQEGHLSGKADKAKQSSVSSTPCLLDLNKAPVDEPCPESRRYFLQDLNCPYTDDTALSSEKSGVEDPTPFSSPRSQNALDKDGIGTASPASYTSCCSNNSRIESRSSSPLTMVPSCRTRLEYPETEASPSDPCNREDSTETSSLIQRAAESLLHISCDSSYHPGLRSNRSYKDRDLSPKLESGDAEQEYSCDSYELLNIELTESGHEDYCVSSRTLDEENVTGENEGCGVKLRRGRRMKNFQKEILPGLVSLSRTEIREDINVLEAVLRSREYKKMQTGRDDKCRGTNPRRRRSGQRYVGRRRI